ncbi:MAG TPA: hypothetical protein VF143_05620 [Candidatus Nanopelagicales bacterium]
MASHPSPVRPATRRATIATLTGGALALAGLALTAGAASAGAVHPAAAGAVPATSETIGEVWAQLDAGTQATICTGYLLDADGTWQQLAPVLVEAGITHDQATAHLAASCSAQRSVHDLRD